MDTCRRRPAASRNVALGVGVGVGAVATLLLPAPAVAAAGVLLAVVARVAQQKRSHRAMFPYRGYGDGGGDLGGVREPRRPRVPQGSMALDPPTSAGGDAAA